MAFPFLMAALRAHGERRQRRLAANRRQAEGRLVFEALEPRVLLSADALTVALSGDAAHPMAHDVVVEAVSQALPNIESATVQMVQVVDLAANDQVLASAPLGSVSGIKITSGTGDTSLTVATASFGTANVPAITFAGGNGNNTLAVTGSKTTDWNITGNDAGTVTGSAAITFTGVANLSGGAENTNVFTVTQGGALTGTLSGTPDGSAGGNDSLVFKSDTVTNAAFTAAGPHSGTIDMDGSVFTYAGLTPIIFSGNASNITITGTANTDDLTLADTNVAGQLEVASLNNSLESVTFARPSVSLTVDFGTGSNDSLQIGTVQLAGASLTVAGGNGTDSISVDANAYVSTRDTTGNALTAPSVGNSGDLSLSAETITVNTGAKLYANANSGFTSGDVTLDAGSQGGAGQTAAASIAVHGAQIVGGDVDLDSAAGATATITQQTLATLSLDATAQTAIDGASGILATVGDVQIDANVDVTGQVTANAAPLGSLNADAALALSDVTANGAATVSGTTVLGAAGAVDVHSGNTTSVTTLADGSTGGATAVGGAIALADVSTGSTAQLGTGVKVAATTVAVEADSADVVGTTANATAGGATANGAAAQAALAGATTPDGSVTVAAALAATTLNDTNTATSDATTVTTTGGFDVIADTSRLVDTGAIAIGVQGGPGVGAAVALNAISVSSSATLGDTSTIYGNADVDVGTLRTGDIFGAVALSGAGSTDVGVAGALAVNAVSDDAFAGIAAAAQVSLPTGSLTVGVGQDGDAITDALAFLNGASPDPGVGASVAIAPVHFSAEAGVQAGAQLSVGTASSATESDASFSMDAQRTITTVADGGVADGTATAAALALTVAQDGASAELDAGAVVTVQGNLTLTATQTSDVHTSGSAEAGATATVAAFGIVLDNTDATTAATVVAQDAVSLTATGQTASTTLATAGPVGAQDGGPNAAALIAAELGFIGNPPGVTLPTPATADGAFGVAAAMALGVAIGRVSATVLPETASKEAISAQQISLEAAGEVTATTRADASPIDLTSGRVDVGAALALQTGQAIIVAEVDSPISAPDIALLAEAAPGTGITPNTVAGLFTVQAIAGAGESDVGVAGAMAIAGDGITVQALLDSAATSTSSGVVVLAAVGDSTSNVDATALSAADGVGAGASFSLNVSDATVTAEIEDGGSVTGTPGLLLGANGGQNATTTAEGGTDAGTATGAAFALAVVTDEITAGLTTRATAAAGTAILRATGDTTATTTTTGAADGQYAAIGASLALGILVDDVSADVAGRLIATGPVTMTATGTNTQTTTADAGSLGAEDGSLSAGALLANQLALLNDPNGIIVPALTTGAGTVGVAAALSFGVDDATVETDISGRVLTEGDLTMTATGGTTAKSEASGATVDPSLDGTGVAAAVAVMVATPKVSARIDGDALAADATLTANMATPTGHDIESNAESGAGDPNTGVAGSFALTVAAPVTEAVIGGSGILETLPGGNVTLSATGASQIAADARAEILGPGRSGLGASVALDIALDDTHAMLDQGAQVLDANNLTLTAKGTYGSAAHAEAGDQSGGAAGAIAINVAPQDTEAEANPGPSLTLTGTLMLQAEQNQGSIADANGGSSDRGGGFGAALAVNAPVASTTALLDRGANVANAINVIADSTASAEAEATAGIKGGSDDGTADGLSAQWLGVAGTDGSTTPPTIPSISAALANGAQQLGLTLPEVDAAAALSVDAAFGTTSASIAGGDPIIAGGNVLVLATGGSTADSQADASAITTADAGAVGFGFAVDFDDQALDASIGAGTPVSAQSITVQATVPREQAQQASAEAMSGAGASDGIAGALALSLVDNSTEAQILSTAPITAPGFIVVEATGDTSSAATAGEDVNGTVAGTGISLAGNLMVDHTAANVIAGADLNSLGQIRIEADGTQSLQSESAGTATAGLGAVPASLTADVLLATTAASVGDGAKIDTGITGGTATQNLLVLADDSTSLNATAGSLGAGALAGAGAAAQFSDLLKQTTADMDGTVQVAGSVEVEAQSKEAGFTAADAGAMAAGVSVAGGAGVQMGDLLTHAAIDGDAHVRAVGDVVVTALDTTQMDVFAGAVNAAVAASAGAGIGAIGLMKTTEALIENNAVVDAEGEGAGTQVANGFTISFVPGSSIPGEVAKPFLPSALTDIFGILLNNPLHNLISPVGSIPSDDFSSQDRVATPTFTTVHGVAVTALSHDDLALQATGLGASDVAGLELSASGVVDNATTRAEIGAGALVDQSGLPSSTSQSVLVFADGDTQAMVIAGTDSISGLLAVGPAAALLAIDPDTIAFIGAGAKVSAIDDLTVQAVGTDDLLTDATDVVASDLSVAGSVDALVLGGETYAYVDANATVIAGGSVSIVANETSQSENVAGALSDGTSGPVAVGASAGISLVATDTEAWIASDAHVTALGLETDQVPGIETDPTSATDFTVIEGVSVLATTNDLVMDLVVNGSAGGFAAFIGSGAGVVIGNTTAAYIGTGAVVHAGAFGLNGLPLANATPATVSVGAVDNTHSFDGIASVVDGDLAISGAADAGVMRDATSATIDAGATIKASGDVDVAAWSTEVVDSFVGGLGLTSGGIELNVSASVYSIGAVAGSDLLDPLSVVGGPGSLESYLDGLLQGMVAQAGQGIVGILNQYAAGVGGQQAAATQLAALTPNDPVTGALTASNLGKIGTLANIDDAKVTAYGNVGVTAVDAVTPDLDTSFTFSYSFGSNDQNLNLSLDGGLLAGRANATASITGGSDVTATDNVAVQSQASTTQTVNSTYAFNSSSDNSSALVDDSRLTAGGDVTVNAQMNGYNKYSGILPGINGLKIRTSYNNEQNTTIASVTGHSVIDADGTVTVNAFSTSEDHTIADGATLLDQGFEGSFTLGVALAWNQIGDTTSATITDSNALAASVAVTATADTEDFTVALGIGDGDNNSVSLGGSGAENLMNDIVSASIEGATVLAPGGVSVLSTDDESLTAITGAAVARTNYGISAAVSLNTSEDVVSAEIGDSTVTTDSGGIQVVAVGTGNMSSLAAGVAQGKNLAGGVGAPVDTLGMLILADVTKGSVLTTGAGVTVTATGNGTIMTLAGGVAIALNQVGVGAAVSINNASDSVTAQIVGSQVTAGGAVDVEALSDPTIEALAFGFAYAPTIAVGGSVAYSYIDDTTTAEVDNSGKTGSKIYAGDGAITVMATDAPYIEVLTGAIAASSGEVAVAASVSINNVNDTVTVGVNDATLTAPVGPIIVQGVASPNILSIAVGGSGDETFAGVGAVADDNVGSTMTVTVGTATAVLTAPVVTVDGADNSNIGSAAYGVAGSGTVSIAGAVATNTITGGMVVSLDSDGVIDAQVADVEATNAATIEVMTGAADGAGTASGGAATSVNAITDDATSQVVGGKINAADTSVTASQTGTIEALATIGSGAGTADLVASVTTNNIYDAATATISSGAVINTGSGGSLTLSSTNGGDIESLSGAINGAGAAAINGAVANNNISLLTSTPGGANTTLENSTVTGGSANVDATDSATILSVAISGGGASTAAVGGSVTKANGNITATVAVTNNKETLTGALDIAASDSGDITTAAGNAEGAGTFAGGAAIAINTLNNNVTATLTGGNANVGSLSVTATANGSLGAVGAIGGGAGTVALDVSDTENTITGSLAAAITGGAVVTANGAVTVGATDQSQIESLSGAADGAGTVGGGAARAHNRIGAVASDPIASDPGDADPDEPSDATPSQAATTATIDDGSFVEGESVAVTAAFTGSIETAAIAGSGAGTAAIAGALTDNLIGDQVTSSISGANTTVFAAGVGQGQITVSATDGATIKSLAGSATGAGVVAVGVSAAVNKLRNAADASIDAANVWSLSGSVAVIASENGLIESISVAGSGGGDVALDAAVSLNDIADDIGATVDDSALVRAAQDITLHASDGGTIESSADGLAISGGFSGAGAVATNEIGDQITAGVTDATLRAIDDSVFILTDDSAGIENFSFAAGAGSIGLTATVSVNEIDNVLMAEIDASTVTAGNDVALDSTDNSSIGSIASQFSFGVLVGAGGAAAYNQIENSVGATIDDGSVVTASSGDVLVEAQEQATIQTLAAGAAGGTVGIGGSVSVSIIANTVDATIANATVTAAGNVGIIADDQDTIDAYGGELAGGFVGAAGSVAVVTLESQITASVENATVAARGITPALIMPDIDQTTGAAVNGSAGGVVVAARDLENAKVIAVTGAGGLGAIAGTVSDVHTATVTDAHITGSQINSASKPGSGVTVHASQATIVTTTLGAIAGGFVAVGGAVQVTTIDNRTQAYIADQVTGRETPGTATAVYANTINVSTATYENVSPTTVGVTVGAVAISGSVAYTNIASSSDAFVRDALLQAKNGAASITVAAEDNASIGTFAGDVSAGFVGAGAAVAVSEIGDTTLATLEGARLDANGAITVSASSTGNITDVAAGAAGGAVGIAGAVLVDSISTETEAATESYGGAATLINQDPGFAGTPGRDGGSLQSVTIEATGNETLDGTAGAAAIGLGAAGAGIQVGSIADLVAANVEGGTVITAAGNVSVTAKDQRNASSDAIAVAGGLLALSGAFSIITIGGAFDPSSVAQVNAGDTGSGPTNDQQLVSNANSSIDEEPAASGISTNQQTTAEGPSATVAQNAVGKLNQPAPTVGDNLFATPTNVSGTFATVDSTGSGGAPRITAGGNIAISASDGFSLNVSDGSGGGGLVSLGLSVGLATVTDTTTASATGGAVLAAGGDITVDANDASSSLSGVGVTTGSVGAIAVGGAVGDATLNLDVTAELGPDVTVTRAAGVDINTTQTANLAANGFDIAGGLAALGDVTTSTTIGGTVVAEVGQGSDLGSAATPIGTLTIAASGSDIGTASTTAGSGGVVAGESNSADATVNPDFSAVLDSDTTSDVAGSVAIVVQTSGVATTSAEGVTIGAGAIGLSDAEATLAIGDSARIGDDAMLTAGGNVTISAEHTTTADPLGQPNGSGVTATADSSGGGAISGNGATAGAYDNSTVAARVGEGSTVDAGGTLAILATVSNSAQANTNTLSIGVVAIGGQTATANTEGQATAALGNGTTVRAFGLEVEGAANDASDATSIAAAGGIFGTTVGAEADTDASPKVTASIGSNANVAVLSTVDVLAIAEPFTNGLAQGSTVSGFYAGGSSNANSSGTPDVEAEIEQDSVVKAGGGVQILAEVPTIGEISNGTFDASNGTVVSLANNEFYLVSPTLLQTGDQVVYETDGGKPIGGLTDGRTYSVINDGNGISLGQTFTGAQVNAATGTIQFAAPDGFMTGDKVVYSANGGTPIGGLVSGETYYVRVINPTTIKLATSLAEAEQVGESFNPTLITGGNLITLANNGFTNGEAVTYRSTGAGVAGLVNGDTYFVQRVNANQFRLSALPNGPALSISPGFFTGGQTLGAEGVAIDGAGITSPQSLTFDLTSLGTGVQRLAGVGGAAALLPFTPNDTYDATANASGGALVGNVGSQTDTTINGTTTAVIGSNTTVQSGGELTISVTAQRPSTAVASGIGAGLVGLGSGSVTTNDTENTSITVGDGSSLVAGQDVMIDVDGGVDANASSQSNGGGAVKVATSNTTVTVDPTTGIFVGQGARITAAFQVTLGAQGEVGGLDQASSGGFGFFASDSDSYTTVTIGAPVNDGTDPAVLSVQIGDGANLSGGNILLIASYDGLNPQVDTYADATGGTVYPTAISSLNMATNALVDVGAGAILSAANQVTLLTNYGAGGTYTLSAVTDRTAVVGHQDAGVGDFQQLASNIDVEDGAVITAHNLQASATIGASEPNIEALEGGYNGDEQPDNIQQSATEIRNIVFDGEAVLTAGPSPVLVVNEFGQIAYEYGVTASVSGGNIVVNPITDTSPGVATFSSDEGSQWMASGNGVEGMQEGSVISGTEGSITFVDTFPSVTLDNGSALNMVVNGIDPVLRTPGAAVNVQLDDTSLFSFTLANVFRPTTITVANTAPTGIGNLTLTGDIEDPIGAISLSAAGGNIVASGNAELVRGASVTLDAGGNIGTAAQRLTVDVVDSPQAGITLNASAGGDLNLAVQARLRDPSAFIFTPTLGDLVAGGSINLDLLQPVRDNTVVGPEYKVTVYDQSPTYGLLTTTHNENAWPNDVGGPQPLPPGVFATGSTPYAATYSIGLLEAGGSISVIDPGSTPIGLAAKVELFTAGGSISATMSGDITLTETTGNLRVGKIDSTGGSVTLTALAGSIVGPAPGGAGQPASVIGDNIALTAAQGSIGSLNDALNIQLLGGKLDALARNGINIYDVSGALPIDSVAAGGAVLIGTAGGNILVAPGAAGPEVVGQTVALTAKGGIGITGNPLVVQSAAPNGVTSNATGRTYIDEVEGVVLHEAGLTWTLGDGGTSAGRVNWASLL